MEWVFIGAPSVRIFIPNWPQREREVGEGHRGAMFVFKDASTERGDYNNFGDARIPERPATQAIEGPAISKRVVKDHQTQRGLLPATLGRRSSGVARERSDSSHRKKLRGLCRSGNHRRSSSNNRGPGLSAVIAPQDRLFSAAPDHPGLSFDLPCRGQASGYGGNLGRR